MRAYYSICEHCVRDSCECGFTWFIISFSLKVITQKKNCGGNPSFNFDLQFSWTVVIVLHCWVSRMWCYFSIVSRPNKVLSTVFRQKALWSKSYVSSIMFCVHEGHTKKTELLQTAATLSCVNPSLCRVRNGDNLYVHFSYCLHWSQPGKILQRHFTDSFSRCLSRPSLILPKSLSYPHTNCREWTGGMQKSGLN
jgi:hypothetical protein